MDGDRQGWLNALSISASPSYQLDKRNQRDETLPGEEPVADRPGHKDPKKEIRHD